MRVRRAAIALGVSATIVVVIAALVPRSYLSNDDVALTEFLRKNMFTPWISPILAQLLGHAYQLAPDVPWFGLYQYAVTVATGAVLIHSCTELIDPRPGIGRIVTMTGAIAIGASNAILATRLTWTLVSISATGTAMAAFVAHAQTCHASGKPVSRTRGLVYGLLLVAGLALRSDGAVASGVALLPMLGWAAVRFLRHRHIPRLGALIGFVGPVVVVLAIQHRIPQAPGAETGYTEFNIARGQLNDQAPFMGLEERAPGLLERAGWSHDDYHDFVNWLLIYENDYTVEKMQRLIDTGGVPYRITWVWGTHELHQLIEFTAPSVSLFLTIVISGVVLAGLGTIARWCGLAFSLGYTAFLISVPLWMSAHSRFPQRVTLSFYTVAAFGMFVFLARLVSDRRPDPTLQPMRDLRAAIGVLVVAVVAFGWARHLMGWLHQARWSYRDELQLLDDRIAARKGFVFVYIQTGLVDYDPLRAQPRGYEGMHGGWATFSAPWYDAAARLGVHHGSEVFTAMVDNPNAYMLTSLAAATAFEEWIQRKTHKPTIRLALVDSAALAWNERPMLYRLITHPMVPGDSEWRALQYDEWQMNNAYPGPPSTAGLAFRAVSFTAPYMQYRAPLKRPAAGTLTPIEGGVRCEATASPRDVCPMTVAGGNHVGVHISVDGLSAARFEIVLIDPSNIVSLSAYAGTENARSVRWRWELGPEAQRFGFEGTFTLVPGYPAHRLQLAANSAESRDLRDLDIFVEVKPGSHAGFELRHLEVAEP